MQHASLVWLAPILAGCGGGGGGAALGSAAGIAAASAAPSGPAPIPPGQIDAAVAGLDGLAAELMQRSNIPGMAVAVVRDGRTVYARGFGVRRIGSPETIDPGTVFQLASMSKSISATAVAAVVGRKIVSWDTPVTTELTGFALSDAEATRQVTIGDFFAHRSGLPPQVADQLEVLGFDRAQILERLRFAPVQGFRTRYAYGNFGLTAGAEAAASAAGLEWAALCEQNIYQPLGMASTSSRFADFMQRGDRAALHVQRDGRYQALYQRNADAQSAAGGISSSVNDVARWLAMVLQSGAVDGRVVVRADGLLPAISPQIRVGAPGGSSENSYGFGFLVTTAPSGRIKLQHSGAFTLGASTSFTVVQSAGVAIVTLTNAMPTGVPEAMNAAFEDLVEYGRTTRDWYAHFQGLMEHLNDPAGSLAGQQPPADAVPALGGKAYAGNYLNSYFGTAAVQGGDAGLVMKMGPGGMTSYVLRHWSANTFVFDINDDVSRVDFAPDASGVSQSLQIEAFSEDLAGGVFTRIN